MSITDDVKKLVHSIDGDALLGHKKTNLRHLKIVVMGVGAIGGSVGGWIAENYDNIWFHDLPDMNARLREQGLVLYPQDHKEQSRRVAVRVIDDLSQAADADVVVLGVKTYSLPKVAGIIRDKLGDRPVIVAMQNGVENQRILPQYFSKVVYCVISYNAWLDAPGVIGYQKKGPLHIGTAYNELQDEMADIARIFNLGLETVVTTHLADAAHCKLIINLTNSLTTLVGMSFKPIEDEGLFQKLLTNLLYEGVRIVRAAGYRESRLGGMPPWRKLQAGATLPQVLTRGMFRRNLKKMVISSMAQDVIQRGGSDSELESLNGYMLALAERCNVAAPYNRAVYDLCRREFAKETFTPMDVRDVWREVERLL